MSSTAPKTGARGEGILTLDGEEYPILYTMRALANAERLTGKSITVLMAHVMNSALSIGDLAHLLTVGLEAARQEHKSRSGGYTINDAWRLLDRIGYAQVTIVVMEALSAAMSYGTGANADEGEQDNPLP